MARAKDPSPVATETASSSSEDPTERKRDGSHESPARKPRAIEGENFLEGKLLIALPGMSDPRFEKSVIFMCAHSLEGAMGIMINRAIEGIRFRQLMEKLEVDFTSKGRDMPVLYGGPVETGRGFVLHSGDYEGGPSTLAVSNDICLTATVEILRAMGEGNGPRNALFALGYAGWGPGQIEDEIRANGWIHCDADSSLLFGGDLTAKWSSALHKMGINASGLSAHTGRA